VQGICSISKGPVPAILVPHVSGTILQRPATKYCQKSAPKMGPVLGPKNGTPICEPLIQITRKSRIVVPKKGPVFSPKNGSRFRSRKRAPGPASYLNLQRKNYSTQMTGPHRGIARSRSAKSPLCKAKCAAVLQAMSCTSILNNSCGRPR